MRKILENGIPARNWENKYHSKNPIVIYLMNNFKNSITQLLENKKDTKIKFEQNSIYKIDNTYKADLVVCCEVLEHLETPDIALEKIKSLDVKYYLFSVPNEPVWRALNFYRGNFLKDLGSTPGHINHWSPKKFQDLITKNGFDIIDINNPFPWSMVLARLKK